MDVLAVERAYVAAATTGAPRPVLDPPTRAAVGAVASRYLAVGTPRTFGVVVSSAEDSELALASLAAHRTWFAPRELRCAAIPPGSSPEASEASARKGALAVPGFTVTSLAEALACDIVCVHATIAIRAADLRRGTHVNALVAVELDADLTALATIVREPDLPALAAGLVDGRQLDEITVFLV